MKLELAIALFCDETGCVVSPVNGDANFKADYSALVRDQIHIQPEQMVVVNVETNPPEIVWRWIRAAVIELEPDIIVMGELHGHPAKVSLVPELPIKLEIDDEMWTCGTGRAYEIHDLIVDGMPTQPDRLLAYITPIIEEIYKSEKA